MPDQGTTAGQSSLDSLVHTLTTPAGPTAAPPGAPPLPLPLVTPANATQSPPPFDYKAFGESQAKADFARASAGSGWTFDPEKIEPVINKLQDLVDNSLRKMNYEARALVNIDPPGHELASQRYADQAITSGRSYTAALQGRIDAMQAYVGTLRQIRDAYQRQDRAALDALCNNGKEL